MADLWHDIRWRLHRPFLMLALCTLTLSTGVASAQKSRDPRLNEADKLDQKIAELIDAHRYAEAVPIAKRVLEIKDQILGHNDLEVALSLENLAGLLQLQKDFAPARPLYERALKIRERTSDPQDPAVATTLDNFATRLRLGGDYISARNLYEGALKLRERALGREHPDVAASLTHLATLLQLHGDYASARPLYERALNILESRDSQNSDVATTLISLGILLLNQGDYVSAQQMLERGLHIMEAERGPADPMVAQVLIAQTIMPLLQGDYVTARQMYERALKIMEAYGPENHDVGGLLDKIGAVMQLQGDHLAARSMYERALKIEEEEFGPESAAVGMSLNNLASLLQIEGDYAAAQSKYEQALTIMEKTLIPEHPYVAQTLINFAVLQWRQKKFSAARELLLKAGQAMNVHIQRILPTLSSAEQQAFLDKDIPSAYSFLLSCNQEGRSLESAYSVLFRWKGLLIDGLRRQAAVSRLGQDLKYKSLVERLGDLRSQVAGWYQKTGSLPREEWEQQNSLLTHEKEALERALGKASVPGTFVDSFAGTGRDGLRSLLKSDEVFADIYRYQHIETGEPRYAAVLTGSKSGPMLVDLGSVETANKAVTAWRVDVLHNLGGDVSWKTLADHVWRPISKALAPGTQKVWLSPDAQLSRIPWHLLPETETRSQHVQLSQTNSALELANLRRIRSSDTNMGARPTMLVAASINFSGVTSAKAPPTANRRFEPLDGTAQEAAILEELARSQNIATKLLEGAQATKPRVISEVADATYIHFATHGFFGEPEERPHLTRGPMFPGTVVETLFHMRTRNPLVESGIALAGANLRDPTTMEAKGLLTAEELVGLDLKHTELFVLSACETGRGEEIAGQGVMGFRASVLAAGARSALMSLWKVPDEPTAIFMKAFYTNLWVHKLPKAEALKRAQYSVRDDSSGKFKLPVNWAAWVLVGDGW